MSADVENHMTGHLLGRQLIYEGYGKVDPAEKAIK